MIFYKVVHSEDKSSINSNLNYSNISYKVFYKLNEFVSPNIEGTKLYIFSSLEDVESFIHNEFIMDYSVYECEVINPTVATLLGNPSLVGRFWELVKRPFISIEHEKRVNSLYFKTVPSGTYECDAVKLIKEIEL